MAGRKPEELRRPVAAIGDDIGWEGEVGAFLERLAACEAAMDATRAAVDQWADIARQVKATGHMPGDLPWRREREENV